MNAISPDLLKRLQETLVRCNSFESDQTLKTIFVDSRIAPWANGLPHATNTQERVKATIAYLSQKTRQDTGENGLILLLQVLRDQTAFNDMLHHDLAQLTIELKTTITLPSVNNPLYLTKKPSCQISISIAIGLFCVLILFMTPGAREDTLSRLREWGILASPPCSVTVQDFTFSPKAVQVNGTVRVTVNIDNPNGLGIQYNWSVTDGVINPNLNSLQPNSTYTAPNYPGNQTIMVEVLPIGCEAIQFSGQIVVGDNPIVPTIENTPKLITTPIPDTPTSTNTPEPVATPIASPSNITPTGKLAISLKSGFNPRIYLTAFDGKGLNGEHPNSIPDAKQPMWSRDGNSIMVNAKIEGIDGLFKLNAIGFDPKVVIPQSSARWPVLSPDGKEIIFSEQILEDAMFRRQADGNIIQVWLNNRPILAQQLLWSDDNILVFQACNTWVEGREGECGIWMTSASNLNPQRIIEGNDDMPMDAKSGKLALMNATDDDWEVYIMPLAGPRSQAINLTNNTAQDGTPAISPDGKLVAYISNESGSWAVWTVTVEGTDKKKWFDIDPQRGTVDVQTWADDRMSWSR